jgi:hypothetical protein
MPLKVYQDGEQQVAGWECDRCSHRITDLTEGVAAHWVDAETGQVVPMFYDYVFTLHAGRCQEQHVATYTQTWTRWVFRPLLPFLDPFSAAKDAEITRLREQYTTYARQALVDKMAAISEEYWAATWFSGIEYGLWEQMTTGTRKGGMRYADADLVQLRGLAELAGGWWTTDHDFLPTAEWEALYAQRKGPADVEPATPSAE